MSTFHDVSHEKDKNNRYLVRINGALFLALLLAGWGWKNTAKDITVYYPPNIQLATSMKAGVIPEETIFAFAPLILQQLHLWEKSGDRDYEANRFRLRQFLTEDYQRRIVSEIDSGQKAGTLKGIRRRLQVVPTSMVYGDKSVQPVGNHWLVWLDVEIIDTMNGVEVYSGIHRMAVRVVRYDINRDLNPWQLALDGLDQDVPLASQDEEKAYGNQVKAGGSP